MWTGYETEREDAVNVGAGRLVMEGGCTGNGQASGDRQWRVIVNIPGGDGDTISVTGKGVVVVSL